MKIWPFGKQKRGALGIDIGTSAIRVVELSRHGDQERLENYAQLSLPLRAPRYFGQSRKGKLLFSTSNLAEMLARLLAEAKIESNNACFSIPDFSTLFTTFSLPSMKKEEVPQAVRFEARQRVPLPISEVTLDWLRIGGDYAPRSKEQIEILMVVVPNRIIDRYTRIAELCNLSLAGVEAEVFALQRALLRGQRDTVGLIDIGAQSTTISVIDDASLKISHSFDIAGNDLTQRVVDGFDLSYKEAKVIKENQGLLGGEIDIRSVLFPVLDSMLLEIKRTGDRFYNQRGKEIKKYIIAGATASLPGLDQYFSNELEAEVEIAFPFRDMVYPPLLEEELKKIGPAFSIATGMAVKGLGRI